MEPPKQKPHLLGEAMMNRRTFLKGVAGGTVIGTTAGQPVLAEKQEDPKKARMKAGHQYHSSDADLRMIKAMRVYKEVGYDGMIMPDHVPQIEGDRGQAQAFAFAFGYIQALIQLVDRET